VVYPCNVADILSVSLENEKRFPIRSIFSYFYAFWHYSNDTDKRLDRFNYSVFRNVSIIFDNVSGG